MELAAHDHYCPVADMLCPQGKERARECQSRFERDFDPMHSLRDFDIICCSFIRTEEIEKDTPLV